MRRHLISTVPSIPRRLRAECGRVIIGCFLLYIITVQHVEPLRLVDESCSQDGNYGGDRAPVRFHFPLHRSSRCWYFIS